MFTRKVLVAALSCLTIGLTSCMNDLANPDEGQAEANDKLIEEYIRSNNLQTIVQPQTSGMYVIAYSTNTLGPFGNVTGLATNARRPAVGDEVSFVYRLYLLNNPRAVDSATVQRPVQLPFGVRAMIAGLEEGLSLMTEGQQMTLLIPYYIAYGNEPRTDSTGKTVIIPAFSPVRFDVQLLRTRNEETQIREYIESNKLAVSKTTPTGVRIISGSPATPDSIGNGKTVKLKYVGKLLRGNAQFDSGEFQFVTGSGQVVPGFNDGVVRLRPGEKATLIFPSSQGYGARGSVRPNTNIYAVPPYAPLRFDVEILEVK